MNKCETQLGDTFVQTPSILSSLKTSNDEIVLYVDPPFDFRDGMEDIYDKSFKMISQIENENIFIVIVEHVSTLETPQTLGKFSLSKTKKFGKSSLSYYKYS